MNKNLIYIYNMLQAEFILKEIQSDGLYRIGKGTKGDILVSFFNTQKVRQAINKWDNKGKINKKE